MIERKVARRLGELFMDKGCISAAQLETALKEQRTSKEFIGAILVRKGWVTEEELLKTLGEQYGIPYVRLAAEQIDWSVAGQFSPALTDRACFPMRMDETSVTVAITNPLDAWVLSELGRWVGRRKLQLVLASEQEIRAAIRRSRQQAISQSLETLLGEEEDDTKSRP